jgi:hypothetical protein
VESVLRHKRVLRVISGPVEGTISKASCVDLSAPNRFIKYCEIVVKHQAILHDISRLLDNVQRMQHTSTSTTVFHCVPQMIIAIATPIPVHSNKMALSIFSRVLYGESSSHGFSYFPRSRVLVNLRVLVSGS